MRTRKYLICVLAIVLILSMMLMACQPKDSNPNDEDANSYNDDTSNNPDDPSIVVPDTPVDPPIEDAEIDIEKAYIVNPMSGNTYAGINNYIGEYQFATPDPINIPDDRKIEDIVGVSNVNPKYHFTSLPVLQEGAEMTTKDLGLNVYRFYLGRDYESMYSFNHDWPQKDEETNTPPFSSLTDLAKNTYYSKIFANSSIKTFVIDTYEFNTCEWYTTVTQNKDYNALYAQYLNTTQEFYNFAKYLFSAYGNTSKTFVLTTRNSDIEYGYYYDMATNHTQKVSLQKAYTKYLNARQDGINKAVAEYKNAKAKVYGCIEVNHLYANIDGVPARDRLIDIVIPNTYADIYSLAIDYNPNANSLIAQLEYLASKVPNPNPDFADSTNIMLGSLGIPANKFSDSIQMEVCRNLLTQALELGVVYAIYDSYFCHSSNIDGYPQNHNDVDGYWLVNPKGEYSSAFWYLKSIVDNKDYLAKTPLISLDMNYVYKTDL